VKLYQLLFETTVAYSGILKLKPTEQIGFLQQKQKEIKDPEAVPLKEESLHVTLVHQTVLKDVEKTIGKAPLKAAIAKFIEENPAPDVEFTDEIEERQSEGRKTWVVWVKDQRALKEYVLRLFRTFDQNATDPEPERKFHVSLANLTGNAADSVR
jgi:hypothetical protein